MLHLYLAEQCNERIENTHVNGESDCVLNHLLVCKYDVSEWSIQFKVACTLVDVKSLTRD